MQYRSTNTTSTDVITTSSNAQRFAKLFLKFFGLFGTAAALLLNTPVALATANAGTGILGMLTGSTNTLAPMIKKAMPSIVSVSGIRQMNLGPNSGNGANTSSSSGDGFNNISNSNSSGANSANNTNSNNNNAANNDDTTVAFGFGSGIVVDAAKGFIITNAHVVSNFDEIWVTLNDKRKFDAKIIGVDKASDLAVLQIQAPNLQAIPFADSDKVAVGDFVVAIGNPFGLEQTVTSGIISALSRTDVGLDGYFDLIQTDAAINMGNSGGGLLNLNGELVGINTALLSPSANGGGNVGLGFAIPANMAKNVYAQLAESGHVDHGSFGVKVQFVTPDLAEAFGLKKNNGALINDILPNTPAEKAKLQVGDVILAVNNKEVQDPLHLRTLISLLKPKSDSKITIVRNGKTSDINIQVANPRDNYIKGEALAKGLAGAWLETATQENSEFPGVLVADLDMKSVALKADLRKGDVIVMANKNKITNVKTLQDAVAGSEKYIILQVVRDKSPAFVAVKR
jgi:serine protease Do/serine protease DegQ